MVNKVPEYLSKPDVVIDLNRVNPVDKALLFRDMGFGDPLEPRRTIEDKVDLSPEAKRAIQEGEGPGYDPGYRP